MPPRRRSWKKSKAQSSFPFFGLPLEIRNIIYDFMLPESHVLVTGNHPQKQKTPRERRPGQRLHRRKKPRYRLHCQILNQDSLGSNRLPTKLLKVCRRFNEEIAPLLYKKATFRFTSMKPINKFLDVANKQGIQAISSLGLCHSGYGEPKRTEDVVWKNKQDAKWTSVCKRLAAELISLDKLDIDLRISTWPTQMEATAEWAQPLMYLKSTGVHSVSVTLRHYRFPENRLAMTARKLEDLMMTEAGREERGLQLALEAVREFELEAARKAALPPIQAKKVLVIKQPTLLQKDAWYHTGSGTPLKANKLRPIYKTKGLEQYARVDLSTVGVAFC